MNLQIFVVKTESGAYEGDEKEKKKSRNHNGSDEFPAVAASGQLGFPGLAPPKLRQVLPSRGRRRAGYAARTLVLVWFGAFLNL